MGPETKVCQNCKGSFAIEPADYALYEKIKVPVPTWCPDCRSIRRMLWRNERILSKRKCDSCGTPTFSMYPDSSPYAVYCRNCWLSDAWDPMTYGRPYDPNLNFFQQFRDLFDQVPHVALVNYGTNVDCDFTNYIRDSKQACLAFSAVNSENVAYCMQIDDSKDCFDVTSVSHCERCYGIANCDHCYNCRYLFQCRDCVDSLFLYGCINCQNCFMSGNLRSKQYVWRGEQLSREEYLGRKKELSLGDRRVIADLWSEFLEVKKGFFHKYSDLYRCEDSTGDALGNSKNCWSTYYSYDLENVGHVIRAFKSKDFGDVYSAGTGNELVFEGVVAGQGSSNIKYFCYANGTRDSQYIDWCQNCVNCFGCVGLRNRSYCILNTQYSEAEYTDLVEKIIQNMDKNPYVDACGNIYKYGEFFPPDLAPFTYNGCVAQEYYPKSRKEVEDLGFRWSGPQKRDWPSTTLSMKDVPALISEAGENVIKETIQCAHADLNCDQACTHAFRVLPQEYDFYKLLDIPLPILCPNCRYYERLKLRNPLKLWHRKCMKTGCPNEFETSYAPDRPEIIYCEACYNSEIA